jgi:hypothetical protein
MFAKIRATPEEIATALPGDDIVLSADGVMDRAFTLPGTPAIVWPWFMQLGKNRAGWYFPRSIEALIPKRRRALRHIEPNLQNLAVGKIIDDWGGPHATFEVAILEPPYILVYTSKRGNMSVSWAITLRPADNDKTRVQLRLRFAPIK